jgi:hypothetical protein
MYPENSPALPQQPAETPALSPESRAESEARYQAILAVYSSRFSDAHKLEIRRLCFVAQPPLDHLRSYIIENGDNPALYLKPLVEREKKLESPAVLYPGKKSAKKP